MNQLKIPRVSVLSLGEEIGASPSGTKLALEQSVVVAQIMGAGK